ncbi:hypothetical protein SASPL_148952 [Salvia splendens]|uniref:Retrotransposon gag domain-containing protein n=1 Tax=Salvia splendens TaxID=180675 RepID=A0A8X8Z4S4_SALSN|nr:hypothetical protein SASPL_148952 [Salvia splendens]
MASDDVVTGGDDNLGYTLQELGQSMFDIKVRIAGDEKKIQSNRFAQEAFERQQTQWIKNFSSWLANWVFILKVTQCPTLRQTGSLEAYLTEFEPVLRKVSHVGDDTLTSLFIAGLSSSLKHELLIRRPASLSDAIALAQQLAACHVASNTGQSPRARSTWHPRDSRQQQRTTNPAPKPADTTRLPSSQPRQQRESSVPTDYPVVRVSAAERADRTKRGLCWYCPEPYSRSHVCSKKFYALMGDDDESDNPCDEEDPSIDEEAENMVISGDVSRVLIIGPKLRPRSIRVTGMIYDAPVSVLIDGGSTHNFIKPTVAEQLSLSIHTISPFRVFVGNGASLRCDYVSLNTPIYLQGTRFDIDLFLLQVEGPDVILGVQWLQDLGKVLLDFRDLTMEFNWKQSPVKLKGEDRPPKRISYNNLFSLIGQNRESEIFEIVSLSPDSPTIQDPQADVDPVLSSDLPTSFRRNDPYDYPITATASRTVLVDGVPQEQWSVGWASDGGAHPSWESTAMLKKHFPDLHLVDKVAFVDGGVDRNPTPSEETRLTLEHEEEHGIDDVPTASTEQVEQPNNKPKDRKKPAQPTKARPKRNVQRPSKYKDFVPK